MSNSSSLWSPKPLAILTYGVAVLSVTAALIIAWWMEIVWQSAAHVSLFLCAVMFSAWFGGIRPGLLAIVLSVLAFDYYFLALEPRELPRLLFFAVAALFVGSLSAAQRSAAESLRRARDDLQKINEALQAENTERKLAEETLRERACLLDLTHDTVFVRDMNDVITYWNRGAEELYGRTRDEAIGQVSHQLMRTIFAAPLEEIEGQLLRSGRWEGELIHTKRDGTQIVVASRWALQLDGRGKPIAVLETNNDITARKQAEEALGKAQAELAHVTRMTTLGEMTASIAHEINQPLAAVVNNASACLRWLAAHNLEEARQSAALIISDGHRAGEIISRIRALVKKAPPRKDWVYINETILEVIALARSEAQKNRVSLQTQLSSDAPLILGDRIQLQQVILNLIINAIEAMSENNEGPRELQVVSEKDGSQEVLVAVRDSGPGLDPKSLNHLFTAFYTTKPQGMGMGLAISRSIIEAHGGRLWATANEDRGATFQFTLPAGDSVV
jgi:two-component system, LuxR family, sensor kinase FixL